MRQLEGLGGHDEHQQAYVAEAPHEEAYSSSWWSSPWEHEWGFLAENSWSDADWLSLIHI
eukprot:10276311-Alexandrium_andersonii.AAC.1